MPIASIAIPALEAALSAVILAYKNKKGTQNLPDPLKGYSFEMPKVTDILKDMSDGEKPEDQKKLPNNDRGIDEELDTDLPLQDEPHPGLKLPDRERSPEELKQLEEFRKRFLKSGKEDEEDDFSYGPSDYPRGSREWIEEQMRKPIPTPTPEPKKPEPKKPGPKPRPDAPDKKDDRPGHGDPDYLRK